MKPENCIFTLDNDKEIKEQSKEINKYYTILGDQDFIDEDSRPRSNTDSSKVVAKSLSTQNNKERLYIKVGTYGKIFNPMGLFSEGKNNKFIAKVGKKEFEFKQVNNKIFNLYLNFLSTKNLAWLNNAEREMA